MIAATIALVLVRQTVLVARAESVSSDFDTAYNMALSAKIDFERELAADPTFYDKVVYRYERPRLCPQNGQNVPVLPDPSSRVDEQWPAACGTSWTYLGENGNGDTYAIGTDAAGNQLSWDPAAHPIRMELTPPSSTSPVLSVKILATYGQTETGLSVTYQRSSATEVTAYSQSDLRMDAIYGAGSGSSSSVSVRGTLYSGGQMYLPTSSAQFAGAQLLAEGGFVGTQPSTGRLYTTVGNGAGTDPAGPRNIRQIVPTPLDINGLRSSYNSLAAAGCPAGAQPATETVGGVAYSTSLCLRFGSALVKADGSGLVDSTNGNSLGAKPAAYLLMYSGSATAPTVKVYTAATAPAQVGDCLITCDLPSVARADYNAGKGPESLTSDAPGGLGASAGWQLLGELPMPASGVIVTDADTYVGQCPASVGPASAGCAPTTANASVTIVAGSPDSPRNLVLAGSMSGAAATGASPAAQLGLVATKSVVIPFYARQSIAACAAAGQPAGCGNLTVHAAIAALGYGLPTGQSALRAVPAAQGPESADLGNYGQSFTLTGSIAAPSLTAALAGWDSVSLVADPGAVTSPPPNFPGFSNSWSEASAQRLSSYAVCSLTSCASKW